MRNSRSSICLMNTRCSGDKQILARFFAALESRNEVVILKVLLKLLSNSQLDVLSRFQALLLQALYIGWNRNAANIAGNAGPRLVNPPFRDQAVTFQALLQSGRCSSVQIHVVTPDNDAELRNIQVRVL